MSIIRRSEMILKKPKIGQFSISILSDPTLELSDMDHEQFEKGIDRWLTYYKKSGKLETKKGKLPARFTTYIRKERTKGLLAIYPFTTDSEKEIKNGFDFNKKLNFGWQIIIPPTRKAGDTELVFNVRYNRVAMEYVLNSVRSVNEIEGADSV